MGDISPLPDDAEDAKIRHWFADLGGGNEIEEEGELIERRLPPIEEEIAEDVYVAVRDEGSSVPALVWALKHVAKPSSSVVYLIHIFPEVHRIPTPLGKVPKNQVRPEQVEIYMNEQRRKRAAVLQKFLDLCSASKVNVDTILIESDDVSKAILDLIPILNVRKLVLGTRKPNPRKWKEGNGTAEHIQKNAPESCEVKIIRHGEEVSGEMATSTPSSDDCRSSNLDQDVEKNSTYCTCFSTKFG